MSKRLLAWLRILGTILLFGYVMLKAGLLTQDGWSRLLLTLRGTNYSLVLIAIMFNVVLDLDNTHHLNELITGAAGKPLGALHLLSQCALLQPGSAQQYRRRRDPHQPAGALVR